VDLAAAHHAPLLSLSILDCTPGVAHFRQRFAELGEVEFGTVKGGSTNMAGHVHAITLALALFGNGVAKVECMGSSELAHVLLDYADRTGRPRAGVVLNCAAGNTDHCCFYASAYSGMGAIHSPGIGDFQFPWGAARILELIREMVQTGRSPVASADMLEKIAIATAARQAQKSGRAVCLSEITGQPRRSP
jgi:hypothetical protein